MAEVFVNPNHPIVKYLWPLGPDAPPEDRVAATVRAYIEATNQQVNTPLSNEDRENIGRWLRDEEWNMPKNEQGHSVSLLRHRKGYSLPLIANDLASKVNWLYQAPCITCMYADVVPLGISFPVRTRPFSAQSMTPAKLASLKDGLRSYLLETNKELEAWAGLEVCVTVVAIVPERQSRQERRKDVDNMVKGLLDVMEGPIYEDDYLVQHLSVRRVVHSGREAHYLVSVRPVRDERVDVIDPKLRIGWAGRREIVADE